MSLFSKLTTDLTLATAAGAALVDHEIPQKLSRLLDTSIYRGRSDQRRIALTFDDGPSPETVRVLDLLRRLGVQATFFQSGEQVARNPRVARAVSLAGHEIGNHGWSHQSLRPHLRRPFHLPSPAFLHRELSKTQRLLTEVHGQPPRWFRPPYGHRWLLLDMMQRSMGLRCIQWSVIAHDWEWDTKRIAQRIMERAHPGAIVCLHDGRDTQPTADLTELLLTLAVIVPGLQAEGYQFTTVGKLLNPPVPAATLRRSKNVRVPALLSPGRVKGAPMLK